MRAYELYESGTTTMTALDMARHILVPQYGFKEYTPDRMFVKYISDAFYITAQCYDGSMVVSLFNRNTLKTDDQLSVDGPRNKTGDIIGFSEKHKILNKITQWVKQFGSSDPVVESAGSFSAGDPVTYDLQPNKRNSPRGNAVFKSVSTAKKNHAYIETETEGTILVPISELLARN